MKIEELSRVTKVIMMMMEDNGLVIDNINLMTNFIYHAFNDNRIKFFIKEAKVVGFMIWEVKELGDGVDIYISNLVVLPMFRNFSFKKEVEYLKNRYGKIYKMSGHRWRNGQHTYKERHLTYEYA